MRRYGAVLFGEPEKSRQRAGSAMTRAGRVWQTEYQDSSEVNTSLNLAERLVG